MSKNSLRQSAAMSGCTTPVNIVPQDNACNETVHKQREQTAKSQSENDEGNHGTRRMSLGKLLHPWHTSGSSAARLQEADESQSDDVPFHALLTQSALAQQQIPGKDNLYRQPSTDVPNDDTRVGPMTTSAEDFVVVDLKQIITPFASATASSVLQLYRHCQSAGQLLVFQQKRSQSVSKADLLADLTKMDSESDQLDKFARSL
jgi:hypothetical protein